MTEITDILQEHNVRYQTEGHHHCRPGWLQIDCPFCGRNSHRWHMGFNLSGKYFNCWRCGHHSAIKVVAELTGESFRSAAQLLGDVSSLKHEKRTRGKLKLPGGIGEMKAAHLRYLKGRNFNPKKIARLWGVKGISIHSRLSWRLFVPIHFQGETVSWTTRSISDSTSPRYIGASEKEESMAKGDLLYGEDYCRHAVIVHEGITDVWRTGPGAVATTGIGYSRKQVLKLSKYPVRAICFDSEPVAQERAEALADELSIFPGDTYTITLDAKDAGSASDREIHELRKLFLS